MVKYIFIVLILLGFIGDDLKGQLSIVGMDTFEKTANISEEWEIQSYASVRNSSLSTVPVKLRIEVMDMPYGHSYGACWAGGCLPTSYSPIWITETAYSLESMTDMPEFTFVGHYYCYYKDIPCTPGGAKFKFTFFNANDTSDKASYYAYLNFADGNGIQESLCLPGMNTNYMFGNILRLTPDECGIDFTYYIISLNGTCLESATFNQEIRVDMNKYPAGAYIFRVSDKTGKVVSKGKMLVN